MVLIVNVRRLSLLNVCGLNVLNGGCVGGLPVASRTRTWREGASSRRVWAAVSPESPAPTIITSNSILSRIHL